MAGEKEKIDGYTALHSIKIGGAEEVVAENAAADYNGRYRLYQGRSDNPFGIKEYRMVFESGDYLKTMREFTRRVGTSLDALELYRVYRGSPLADYTLTAEDCAPGGMDTDLEGKVVIIKPESLSPEYRSLSFQLSLATGGFGCGPDASGRAVYCTELYSGEQSRWDRSDILGVAMDEVIPKWARLKLTALAEKRPVMDKDLFWQIIDDAREKAGRWQDMRGPLATTLSALEPADILRWGQIFDEYQALSYKNGLWAAAAVMLGGCSDDGFDYFRGWLTAQGKDVFLKALADPESLADLETVQAFGHETVTLAFEPPDGYVNEARFESMLYAAPGAYGAKAGGGYYDKIADNPLSDKEKAAIADEITYAPDIDVRGISPDADREESFKEQRERFPKLYRLFHEDKESVMKRIREAKAAPKQPHKPKTTGKSHSEEL